MNDKLFFIRYLKILYLQAAAVVIIIISLTAIRYLTPDLFSDLKALYNEYFNTEISLSLVMDGQTD